MTVQQLIALLEQQDPNKEVFVALMHANRGLVFDADELTGVCKNGEIQLSVEANEPWWKE